MFALALVAYVGIAVYNETRPGFPVDGASTSPGTSEVTVDGEATGEYAEQETECGYPLFFVWGGATAHFDDIEARLR